jgi:hypothetical protein
MHGLPTLSMPLGTSALTVARSVTARNRREPTTVVYTARLPSGHVTTLGRVPLTTVARTVCDLARVEDVETALVAPDAALHQRRTTMPCVVEAIHSCYASPHSRRLSGLYELASAHSESPYETLSRFELIQSGHLVVPQVWAYDEAGPIGCGDVWLPLRGHFSRWTAM